MTLYLLMVIEILRGVPRRPMGISTVDMEFGILTVSKEFSSESQ
jgi:hypothetical protein